MHYCWCYPIYSRCIPIKSDVNRPWHCFFWVRVFKVPEEHRVFCIFSYSLLWYRWPVEFDDHQPCDFYGDLPSRKLRPALRKKITSAVSLGFGFLVATGSLTFLNDIPNTVPNFHRISQLHHVTASKIDVAPHTFARQKTMDYGGIHTVHKESWILHASTIQHRFLI